MELINRVTKENLATVTLAGRRIDKAVGKDAPVRSGKMTMGFALYTREYGIMEPHRHAEEICYVLSARNSRVRWGPEANRLTEKTELQPGMTLHFPRLEWHVFEVDEGGRVEIIYFYGQVENIRAEETSG